MKKNSFYLKLFAKNKEFAKATKVYLFLFKNFKDFSGTSIIAQTFPEKPEIT